MTKSEKNGAETGKDVGRNDGSELAEALRYWAVVALGWSFVLFGIVGLIFPVLHGILFLLIGFSILARKQAWAKRLLDRLRRRFPEYSQRFEDAEQRATKRLERLARRAWARTKRAARNFEKHL
ncbi:MAG: PGPGW domain-containing protein [Kiloniellales bacterium]